MTRVINALSRHELTIDEVDFITEKVSCVFYMSIMIVPPNYM